MPPSPKHAYLIMAHNNPAILVKLLKLLDSPLNDIYLHIDAKSRMKKTVMTQVSMRHSKLVLIKPVPVYWADYSQVEVTLRLLERAVPNEYSYYHLISGVDMPLKTNEERYRFFEDAQKEFIGIVPKETDYALRHIQYYQLLLHNRIYRYCKPLKLLNRWMEYAQKFAGVNRLKHNTLKIVDGWTWFSISHDLSMYLLKSEKKIRSLFRYSIAADEMFIHTLVFNSPKYLEQVYDIRDLKNSSMRFIDWERGKPYIWGRDPGDYEALMASPYMFARKFDEKVSMDIVDQIYETVLKKQEIDA